jgi:hypothetical protein
VQTCGFKHSTSLLGIKKATSHERANKWPVLPENWQQKSHRVCTPVAVEVFLTYPVRVFILSEHGCTHDTQNIFIFRHALIEFCHLVRTSFGNIGLNYGDSLA